MNIDTQEIEKFDSHAAQWWDTQGPLKTLHDINPTRLAYIEGFSNLSGKTILDVGCGGGILSEALAKAGAKVTGIDLSEQSIAAAKAHAEEANLDIHYQTISIDELAEKTTQTFDVITCLEMLEHVPYPADIISHCAKLLKPGGDLFLSTLNRTLKAYLLAIVGAEYILQIIPKKTHDYEKFIRPSELDTWARAANIKIDDLSGLHYNPLTRQADLTKDISVNYLAHAIKL